MTNTNDLATRNQIMSFLSDAELERVTALESAPRLAASDEYIDLARCELGVQKVKPTGAIDMGHVLARSAVQPQTWQKIVALVSARTGSAQIKAG